MKDKTKLIFKWPVRIALIIGIISFLYGGIYTEMYKEGMGFTFINFTWAFLGSIFNGIFYGLIPLVISFVYYRSKD